MRAPRLAKYCQVSYSVRALLAVTTVICLWLGMLAVGARQQRLAIDQLRSVNATVGYDGRADELWKPVWLRECVGDDFFQTVTQVNINDHQDAQESFPLPFRDLETAVDAMRRLPSLRSITFNYTRLHDDDLRQLAPLAKQIETLNFNEGWGEMTGKGLKYFAGWPHLHQLHVFGPKLDGSTLTHVPAIPALEALTWTGPLDEAAFENIARCRRLKHLTLNACTFEGKSLIKLRGAFCLASVMLRNCEPEPAGIITTTTKKGDIISVSPPTSYNFHAGASESEFLLAPKFSDRHYQQWLNNLLPGISFDELFESN
jgi:hypothetical protein